MSSEFRKSFSAYSDSQRPLLLSALCMLWMLFIIVLPETVSPQIIPLQSELFQHEIGCAYIVPQIEHRPLAWPFTEFKGDSLLSPKVSKLVLLEDGEFVGYPHAPHDLIRGEGNGNYSHWGQSIYFSASDCSDPRDNGKRYEISVPVSLSVWAVLSLLITAYIVGIQIMRHYSIDTKSLHKMLSDSRINYYFCASFGIVVVAVLIKYPSLVTSAEFYAETATIFFREAREASLWGILTYVWADYLVTFQLLVSFILVRVFGVIDYFPGAVNFLFLLFIAFSVSLINLRAFRILIESDFLRFIVGLSIGLTPNIELYQLLHSNLFGFTIFLLFIFVDKDQFNRWLFYFLIFLLFMVGIARPNLVAFLPVYIVLLGLAMKAHRIRDIIFYGVGTVSLGLQTYVMIMAQLYWSPRKETGIYNEISGVESLFIPLEATINHYFRTLLGIIFNRQISGIELIITLILIITVCILFVCFYLYRKKRFTTLYYFGLSQILVFGMIYFITFSSPVMVNWHSMYYDMMRWWVYSNYVMYISLIVLAYNTVQEILPRVSMVIRNKMFIRVPVATIKEVLSRSSVVAFSMVLVLFYIYPFYQSADPYSEHDSLSDWASYRHLLNEHDYYIPINPVMDLQWAIRQDNEKLRAISKVGDVVSGVQLSDTEGELKLRSILIVNNYFYNSMKDLVVKAYDKSGQEIAILNRLNDFNDRYLYYYAKERIRPHSLAFFDEKMQSVNIKLTIHLYGKLETDELIVITEISN